MPVTSAILFDVDGTLVDTYRLYMEAYRRALAPFMDRLPTHEEIAMQRPSSERHFLTQWLGEEAARTCHAAMVVAYEELHATLCEGLYDGVAEMLAALRAAGVPLGVVTGKGRRAWQVTERELGLGLGPFAVVVTEDEVDRPKPHPGGLLSALAAMRARPENAVYIGDSVGDVEAARAAGMRVGAALWPKTDPEDRRAFLTAIGQHAPDWLFERPADVTRAFAAWC